MMPDQQLEIAVTLARQGRREEAANRLRHLLHYTPNNVAAWKWLAYTTSDRREAHSAIRHVMRLDPYDPWAHEAEIRFTAPTHGTAGGRRAAGQGCLTGLLMGALMLSGLLLIG